MGVGIEMTTDMMVLVPSCESPIEPRGRPFKDTRALSFYCFCYKFTSKYIIFIMYTQRRAELPNKSSRSHAGRATQLLWTHLGSKQQTQRLAGIQICLPRRFILRVYPTFIITVTPSPSCSHNDQQVCFSHYLQSSSSHIPQVPSNSPSRHNATHQQNAFGMRPT